MNLKGKKIVLRAIELEDADILRTMINDSEVEKMIVGYSFPVSMVEQRKWIENLKNRKEEFRAMIVTGEETIGEIMLTDIDYKNGTAEIHIKIANSKHRGNGFGSDAVKTLTTYAFNELRLNCLYCLVSECNKISQKMFVKCGYEKEGVLRARVFKEGKFFNLIQYSILRSEIGDNYDC